MHDSYELIKERSQTIDRGIIELLKRDGSISIDQLIMSLGKTKEMITNRLVVLEKFNVVKINEDIVTKGSIFNFIIKKLAENQDYHMPLNANDLKLSARHKTVLIALFHLKHASRYQIFDFLTTRGDHIVYSQRIYNALVELTDWGILEQVDNGRKTNYYVLRDNMIVIEDLEELFSYCKELYEKIKKYEVSA